MNEAPTSLMQIDFSREDIPWKHGQILYDLWQQKRENRKWPPPKALRPRDMLPYIEHIMLIDVHQKPLDFTMRLVGTGYSRFVPKDPTGQRIIHLKNGEEVFERFQKAVGLGVPYLGLNQPLAWADKYKEFKNFDGIVLLLGETDQHIDMLILLVRYRN